MRRGFLKSTSQPRTGTSKAPRSSPAEASPSAPVSSPAKQPVEKSISKPAPLITIPQGPVYPVYDLLHHKVLLDKITREARANPDKPQGYVVTNVPIIPPFSPDPWTSCCFEYGVREAILALPGFPSPFEEICNAIEGGVSGAGMGLFATVALQPGDCIISERPLLVMHGVLWQQSNGPSNVREKLIQAALSIMTPIDQMRFMMLKSCKPEETLIEGIVSTNALPIGPLPTYPVDNIAVCATASRINHSCSPNAHYVWDLSSFTCFIRALKPIAVGEEITIAYCYVFDPRSVRQKVLCEKYSFTCTCPTCSLPTAESKRSDIRRKLLFALDPPHKGPTETAPSTDVADSKRWYENAEASFRRWVEDVSLPDDYVTKECLRFVEMLDAETWAVEHVWPALLQKLVKAYCALEDREGAKKWAERAAGLSRAMSVKGDDCGWGMVARYPERTEYWGLRRKMRDRKGAN